MYTKEITDLYNKYLDQTIQEVQLFPDEARLWEAAPGVINPAGTLALHIAGNLLYFIGTEMGNTGYVRDRDAEFSRRDVAAETLVANLILAKETIANTLQALGDAGLQNNYPTDKFGAGRSNMYVCMLLMAHLNYHLGQMNYLRRILCN